MHADRTVARMQLRRLLPKMYPKPSHSPLHDHHFHWASWAEPRVVVGFCLMADGFAVLALATIELR